MNTRMKKAVLAGALVAAASAMASQAADLGTSSTDDERITWAVESKLAGDPHLSGTIEVTTKDGAVTLKGLVATSGEADRAERDVQSVEGVREVDNELNALVGKNF